MPDRSIPGGILTPLVTPFRKGAIDEIRLRMLIERQISAGIDGLIVGDQIGEGLSLSDGERQLLLTIAIDIAAGRIPVVAAAGTNCTAGTIDRVAAAPEAASAVLLTIPYYSKPTAKGIIHHFETIAATTDRPIIIDDDPQRTVRGMTPEILRELGSVAHILGVRHCGGDVGGFVTMPPALKRRFTHYAGDDRTALAYMAAGAISVSSPLANVLPELARAFYDLAQAGADGCDNVFHGRLCRAAEALGQTEPANLKQALSLLTGCSRDVRLPLVPLDDDEAWPIAEFMRRYVSGHKPVSARRPIAATCKFL